MKKSISILFILITFNSYSQKNQLVNIDKNNLAVEGYDLVSYFEGNPKKGEESISTNYKGVNYYFISKENKATFIKSSNKFLPQYGGWCAYAMGDSGELVEVDPETYKIIDDKLYLFYNKFFTNTLNSWNKDEISLKRAADRNWKQYKNKLK